MRFQLQNPKPTNILFQPIRTKQTGSGRRWGSLLVLLWLLTGACQRPHTASPAAATAPAVTITPEVQRVLDQVEADRIRGHVEYLADDRLKGRKPGTEGFELASRYVETQFQEMGLQPAGEGGTFRQNVLLRLGRTNESQSSLVISAGQGQNLPLTYGQDYIVNANLLRPQSQVSAPVVFVGFGISAPQLGHDDYANVDVKGKVVAYFGSAPSTFPNSEFAHFARENNKQALAAERGAVGTILLSTTEPSSSSWRGALTRSRNGSHGWVDAQGTVSNAHPGIQATAQVNFGGIAALFAGSPKPMQQVVADARAGKPQAFDLPVTVQIRSATDYTPVQSNNLVGMVRGADPVLREEYVVYAAHLDHLGVGAPVQGDSIFNGAHDNASGIGMLLEIARSFTRLPQPPGRSILFVAVTAEEMGLLGSDYFATHPTVPAGSMVANLAMDMSFFFHPLLDIVPHGIQHSSLKAQVEQATRHLGIKISPDPTPEQVVFVRSDHYSFIKQGIPALFIKGGYESGIPGLDGAKLQREWRANIYHTPLDNIDQAFDYNGAVGHVRVNFLIGYLVALQPQRPTWNKGDFFGETFGRRNLME
jgi:Zn-dependent M28 family amino/carboxypeptidase